MLSTEGQPTPNWVYGASYNLSWTYGPGESILGANAYDNLRQTRFFKGYHPEDQRHFLRLYGATYLTRFINLGGVFSYQSGGPATKAYYGAFDGAYVNRRSPLGTAPTAPNDIESIGELRLPDQIGFDTTLRINVLPNPRFGSLNLVVDVFNVLNLRTANNFNVTDRANYGMVSGRRAPRRIQLALNYSVLAPRRFAGGPGHTPRGRRTGVRSSFSRASATRPKSWASAPPSSARRRWQSTM